MLNVLLIITFYFNSILCDPLILFSSKTVVTNSAWLQYVYFDKQEVATSCSLEYQNGQNRSVISVQIPITDDIIILNDKIFDKRLGTLGKKLCGFRVVNVQKLDPTIYKLNVNYGEPPNTLLSTFKFNLYIDSTIKAINVKTVYVKLGTETTISSSLISKRTNGVLYDAKDNPVLGVNDCRIILNPVLAEHLGRWTCFVAMLENMDYVPEYIDVILDGTDTVDTWYTEEDGYGLVGCQYLSLITLNSGEIKPPQQCFLRRPDNKLFMIKEANSATQRYTTLGTNVTTYRCQLEFQLPIMSYEIGTWHCNVGKAGGFVDVKSTTASTYEKYKSIVIHLGDPFEISCYIPFSSDNCFIQSPKGELHYGGVYTDFWNGLCSVKFTTSKVEDFGNWTCHYSNPKATRDSVITVEIISASSVIMKYTSEVALDSTTKLLCQSPFPLNDCRFQDAQGNTYHVDESKPQNVISYNGRGLTYGDCGVEIKNFNEDKAGEWKCFVRNGELQDVDESKAMYYSASARLTLTEEVLSTASVIGLVIGVLIALSVIGTGMFVFYRKRRVNRRRSVVTTASDISLTVFPLSSVIHSTRTYTEEQT